jgi:ribosomal protein S18 acetylase RimI-like enzyme
VEIVLTPVAEVEAVLREYYTDIIGRYFGRVATKAEVDDALVDFPSDHLVLLLAKDDDGVLGCIGLDLSQPPFAEVKRVYVVPAARGRGVAQAMLATVEDIAREHGAVTMRLDVRDDLVEARALYAKFGYTKTEPFNNDPFADHPMAKDLLHLAPVDPTDARLTALIGERPPAPGAG